MLINKDCLYGMKELESSTIDMVYLDPPFFTQKEHKLKDINGIQYSFEDKWDSMHDYISYLKVRLQEAKRLLKDTGTIFLHCDTTASHYIKIMLDDIFGYDNFRSEIVWTYKRWSNSKNGLLNAHQTIFFYSKSKNYKFNKILTDYSVTTNIDQILQDRIRNDNGKTAYKTDIDGNVVLTNEKKGVPLSDVWDIPFLNPKAKERVGYPTQKPILLLERILDISTLEGDLVLDPFCGSGTTLVAALLKNRNYIGIDKNPDAIQLCHKRLQDPIKTDSTLMKLGKASYDEKSNFEKGILQHFECNIVQRNKGIDAILIKLYFNRPIAIRIQKENEHLSDAIKLLSIAAKKKNCIATVLIKTSISLELLEVKPPSDMLIIDSYDLTLSNYLENLESKILKSISNY
ncbi:MAG: DNA methyltransferase [Epulopiscium sp. Nele67-Bin004]|nr:MAG: DNA methyltransferase [Epulopiscium sp. Nele67-Bin004]